MGSQLAVAAIAAMAGFDLALYLAVHRRRAAARVTRLDDALRLSEARYRAVIENAADGFIVMAPTGEIEVANAAVERVFGIGRAAIEGSDILDLIPPPPAMDPDAHRREILEADAAGEQHWVGRRADGTSVRLRVALARIEVAGRTTYTAVVQDESARIDFEEQLEHQATHDPLTDLPNRTLFNDRLVAGLEALRRQAGPLAVLLLDLDRFKDINDSLGHSVGDDVLREVAQRLRDTMRREDTVARLGGDEFAILLGPSIERAATAAAAQRAVHALSRPIAGLPAEWTHTVSIGIRMVDDPDTDPDAVLRDADAALYRAKREGRNCVRFSAPGRLGTPADVIDLRQHLAQGAITLCYQPVIDVATGRVTSVEALARLVAADGRLVEPSAFIGVAERSGLIDQLGEIVLGRALTDLVELRRAAGEDELAVSVNVSGRQLTSQRFPFVVRDAIAAARLAPDALILELTDSVDVDAVTGGTAMLKRIAATGVRLALDDFGAGRTRLGLLRDLPMSLVKIDREFVSRVPVSPVDRDIVAALTAFANRRGIVAVAEGVDSVELVEALMALGCTQIQGFLFGTPKPPETLAAVLQEWKAVPAIAMRRGS